MRPAVIPDARAVLRRRVLDLPTVERFIFQVLQAPPKKQVQTSNSFSCKPSNFSSEPRKEGRSRTIMEDRTSSAEQTGAKSATSCTKRTLSGHKGCVLCLDVLASCVASGSEVAIIRSLPLSHLHPPPFIRTQLCAFGIFEQERLCVV